MEIRPGEVDLYETLQVHERAIPEVIDKAYRVLVRKYHPDVHPPEKRQWAHAKMTRLNVAYDVLSDPEQRAEYDAARRLGRSRTVLTDEETVDERSVKCFNHPKRPAVKFCWHCGRPICTECFGGESHGHTVCVPCQVLIDRDRHWRAGEDAEPQQRPRTGPPMGTRGVIVYYVLLAGLFGAMLWSVHAIALAFGNTSEQALVLVGGLAVVFVVLIVQRLMWRVICPECDTTIGHAGFRAAAPWREFLAPQPICPQCMHRFSPAELNQSFD
jgi:hypothetical protein